MNYYLVGILDLFLFNYNYNDRINHLWSVKTTVQMNFQRSTICMLNRPDSWCFRLWGCLCLHINFEVFWFKSILNGDFPSGSFNWDVWWKWYWLSCDVFDIWDFILLNRTFWIRSVKQSRSFKNYFLSYSFLFFVDFKRYNGSFHCRSRMRETTVESNF